MKPSNYRDKDNMAYTRKEYINHIPGCKVVRFTMGNTKRDFDNKVKIINRKSGQISDNALEVARIAALRHLERNTGRRNFKIKLVSFPHQVIREHKRVNVAQTDRFQEGMRQAYGSPMTLAVRVDRRDTIIYTEVDDVHLATAKEALRKASHKLPLPVKIMGEEN